MKEPYRKGIAIHPDPSHAPVMVTGRVASLFAGCVDAISGGGDLILVPTLFSVFPTAAPATLFGTNKVAAVCGTGWATVQYAKQVTMQWSSLRFL